MRLLKNLYRRLDRVQRGLWFRVAASVVALAACGILFSLVLGRTYSLDTQRRALASVLLDETLNREAAISLRSTGTIFAGNQTYGGTIWTSRADLFVDPESGLILAPGPLIEQLLADQKPTWVPAFLLDQPETTWLLAGVTTAWVLLIIWLRVTLQFLLTLAATSLAVLLCWRLGSERWMLALGGVGLLVFTYVLLTRATLVVLRYPSHTLAVAHTVVKEAARLRISLVFIVLLLVGLPLIPTLMLDPVSPLRFRIQTFISSSMRWTYGLAALMTLLLACATVAFEIRDRQIWQLMTKPLLRFHYLLGKWLGVVCVNLVLLLVAGISIFVYTQYLRHQPVAAGPEGQLDRMAVRDQILTARVGAQPVYEELTEEQLRARVNDRVSRDPELAEQDRDKKISMPVWRGMAREIVDEHRRQQRVIPPFDEKTQTGHRTYRFTGLQAARNLNAPLTLKYRFFIGNSSEHEKYAVAFVFNEDPRQVLRAQYVPTVTDTRMISPDFIEEDGSLTVSVVNIPSSMKANPGSMSFEEGGLEVLYQAGGFEMNFARAMIAAWIKLAFLAMLGIAAATFLSFPVACLLSFTIFIAATLGPYLAMSLLEYYPSPVSSVDWSNLGAIIVWAFQHVVRALAQFIVFLLHAFGSVDPTGDLVEGRMISWRSLGGALANIGLLWSGIALTVGYLVFRRRELATYSGQG